MSCLVAISPIPSTKPGESVFKCTCLSFRDRNADSDCSDGNMKTVCLGVLHSSEFRWWRKADLRCWCTSQSRGPAVVQSLQFSRIVYWLMDRCFRNAVRTVQIPSLAFSFLVSNPLTFHGKSRSVKAIAHCSAVVYDGEYGSHIDVL